MKKSCIIILLLSLGYLSPAGTETLLSIRPTLIHGIVFHDKGGNGYYEKGKDEPLEGVGVSNGREVVLTDINGYYELPLRENTAIFVIKPRNWMVPADRNQLPRFYYIHSPDGIPGTSYPGLPPTGSLTGPVNFPLYPADEPDKFDVLVFADPQPRTAQEIYYLARDILPELNGSNAAFGVTLGDLAFDNLQTFTPLVEGIATIGIPWRNIVGNHDIDFPGNDSATNGRGAWYSTFGPTYYSFTYGPAHFVVLDNIGWIIDDGRRGNRVSLGTDQMIFLRNEISRLDRDQLLVLMAHIPWTTSAAWKEESERKELYELISTHPNSVSLVGHHHRHFHYFLDSEDGFPGDKPHHMVSVGSVSGSWWSGAPDEYGIPHAMMSCGTPSSYNYLHIDGNQWKLSLRAARRPADFQMHIHIPEAVESAGSTQLEVVANIFNALPSARVEMKIGEGQWIRMERSRQTDPVRLDMVARETELGSVPWRRAAGAMDSEHIWKAAPGIELEKGVHVVSVRAVDDWWVYEGNRIIYIH
jgi:hypothetical protein